MATSLHYAAGDNLDEQGNYTPGQAGFNLADVSSVDQLNSLPAGVKGMVWLDQGDGVTQSFIDSVKPFIGNPNLYGFYLKDEPDPTGKWGDFVTADNLKAESDWIHANVPGAKTFITMMQMGSSDNPTFANTYNPENTHIDLFGIDPYPVRSEVTTIDYNMIDKTVHAAEAAGIPADQIVPVYQTFGGGNWVDDKDGHYVMPTAEQEQQMIAHWANLVPNPAFDYAYSWGPQNGDQSLEGSPELREVFLQHNTGGSSTPPANAGGGTTPSDGTTGSGTSDGTASAGGTSGGTTPADGTTGSGTSDGTASAGGTSGSTTPPDGTTTGSNSASGSSSDPSTPPSTDPSTGTGTPTPPTTDGGHHGHGHHYGLDFSRLADDGSHGRGGHHNASTTVTANATDVSNAADTASPPLTDTTHADVSNSHGQHHNDHHWHW